MVSYYSEMTDFYGATNPEELLECYGSPLYVYNESIMRQRCREMTGLVSLPGFKVTYSIKANSNLQLLKIAREEGLHADAMSPGEIFVLLKAGYRPKEIFYISNNVSEEEMQFAVERGIMTSVDSLAQLSQYGRINGGGKVAVRFNPGIGAGHHQKVITGGKKTKFGINIDKADEVIETAEKYGLVIAGINQHIGSLFMDGDSYLKGAANLLELTKRFKFLEFVDFGGGFGIPYRKQEGQQRLNVEKLGRKLESILREWTERYGKEVIFRVEPGRYISAECGVLLGRVYAVKNNYGIRFAGTDIGFNVLKRPVMYESHHDIEVYRCGSPVSDDGHERITVAGNICESGDIIAKDRMLPHIEEGDIIGVMDAGAYGYSMASNYNNRLRPAEILIKLDGKPVLIRNRERLEDLLKNFM